MACPARSRYRVKSLRPGSACARHRGVSALRGARPTLCPLMARFVRMPPARRHAHRTLASRYQRALSCAAAVCGKRCTHLILACDGILMPPELVKARVHVNAWSPARRVVGLVRTCASAAVRCSQLRNGSSSKFSPSAPAKMPPQKATGSCTLPHHIRDGCSCGQPKRGRLMSCGFAAPTGLIS